MNIKIRKYKENDYQFTHDLHQKNMIGYIDKYWGGWDSDIYRKDVCPNITRIIENEEEKIGFFVMEYKKIAYLRNIQIRSSYQNMGVGSQILQHCENESIKRGFDYIYLDVFLENPAKKLYDRLGYKTIKKTKSNYIMKKFLKI